MKADDLKAAVARVLPATNAKSLSAQHHYIFSDGDTLRGTNGAVQLVVPFETGVTFIADAVKLHNAVKHLRGDVEIEATPKRLIISASGFTAQLAVWNLQRSYWPSVPDDLDWRDLDEDINSLVTRAATFAAKGETGGKLQGVFVHRGFVYGSSTQGAIRLEAPALAGLDMLVPPDAFGLFAMGEGPIMFAVTGKHVAFQWEGGALAVVGSFGDSYPTAALDSLFDSAEGFTFYPVRKLMDSVRQVTPFTENNIIVFNGDDETTTVIARSDTQEAEARLPYTLGIKAPLYFHAQMFIDALKEADTIAFGRRDEPARMRGDDASLLLMPRIP